MPIKLTHSSDQSLSDKVDAFRQTIKDDEAFTVAELCKMFNAGRSAMQAVLHRKQWALVRFLPGQSTKCRLLVNPKILKRYAGKN